MDFSGGGHENVDISEDDTGGVSKFDPGDKLVVLGNSMDVLLPMNCEALPSYPEFHRHLRRLVYLHNVNLVFLFETWISGRQADVAINRFGFSNSFRVEAQGFSRGIWVLWSDKVAVEVDRVSNQFVNYQGELKELVVSFFQDLFTSRGTVVGNGVSRGCFPPMCGVRG
ncbi:hypothetical protein V6N13_060281 [Hibiscus sabdariffa]